MYLPRFGLFAKMIGLPYPKRLFILSAKGLFDIIAIEDNDGISFLNKLELLATFIEAIESLEFIWILLKL